MAKTDKVFTQIYVTRDYDQFKHLDGNRDYDPANLAQLKLSYKYNPGILSPIKVNSKKEIIDGQHRLEILKALNKEVHYFIANNEGIEETMVINTYNKIWKKSNYHKTHLLQGKVEYEMLEKFYKSYPKIPKTVIEIILSNRARGEVQGTVDENGIRLASRQYIKGTFEMKISEEKAHDICRKIRDLQEIMKMSNSVCKFLIKLFDIEKFEYDTFMLQLQNARSNGWYKKFYLYIKNDLIIFSSKIADLETQICNVYNHNKRSGQIDFKELIKTKQYDRKIS